MFDELQALHRPVILGHPHANPRNAGSLACPHPLR